MRQTESIWKRAERVVALEEAAEQCRRGGHPAILWEDSTRTKGFCIRCKQSMGPQDGYRGPVSEPKRIENL